jgi:uncharacterized membrane protein YjfL (UPF0719 family)
MIVIVIDILFQSNTPYRNIFCISQNNASTSLEDAFHLSLFHMMLPHSATIHHGSPKVQITTASVGRPKRSPVFFHQEGSLVHETVCLLGL